MLAEMDFVIFEAVVGVGSFVIWEVPLEDEDGSSCSMDVLDGWDVVSLFGVGCFFVDVGDWMRGEVPIKP